ncbi:hypothetical protein [Geodermatophilus normandii]|uniref:Uncharacterized protein n=1 Tax=Geodermatophilus normandii TaxID=1137989 RepID=A0A6P0GLR5_9ACTN|nr:hypothetical protein [Geodermatophilus normandii]NEM08277.1 hypothetical protein [Geodermatophilus normandii]
MAAAGLGLAGLVGCSASAGPETGAVTTEDLQDLEDRITGLDDRLGALEGGVLEDEELLGDGTEGGDGAAGADDTDAFFADPDARVGQRVTVSAELSELISTTDVGAVFRIAGESGDPIAVVSATPPPQLGENDVVRVTGTVVQVQRDGFEQDFGVAADELFEDADGWFEQAEGQIAVSADRIEVLDERAGE